MTSHADILVQLLTADIAFQAFRVIEFIIDSDAAVDQMLTTSCTSFTEKV